ncbi:MAG TPA: NAD(P)/FAD-dependent oxidoreductase [Nocardioides sp.]|uniref:flavin-containing monooxygenase n=1 Tax=uncultured Nocardioides sp. TaxID=198441 RepID=UPI00262EBDFF|nr:NAD(P)/FAD-dependent oxidoreductase [uncultured Nocardioides sp.]HRD63397.1 NAD(P)/FAD-dependent oxidoreductase [Nocardioides sp.]HRI97654.1 NAD(P)/FAD-dependent oxidoreductase [Nocardioides sp.]HRK47358.1 NAD(P)/FAD-dependent oxidoreductase [Nocardioides sp.]
MVSTPEHVDVLIVGAGLSGIGAACQLREHHPARSVAVLEAREASGGTWDLFQYPGIRSDSDMFTFSFRWRPWVGDRALADGPSILDYLRTVASEYGVDELIRYRHRVVRASWDSATARWTVEIDRDGQAVTMTCGLLWCASGYYDYEEPFAPEFPGADEYAGRIVHPQHWPADLDYAGQQVVVIGSGATAVTLVPAMAPTAGHVTMLQRSPSYVLSRPARDGLATRLEALPTRVSYPIVRWANILVALGFYQAARRWPEKVKEMIRKGRRAELPDDLDADVHFEPRYNPWDQRLCFVPDGDLFRELREGRASMVTDTIERFDATGIQLTSGRHLDADVVVTATGLQVLAFGGVELVVDGRPVELSETMAYKALMLSGVPNLIFTIGYTNASWTLKADLVSEYVVRLLSHMDRIGARAVVPVREPDVQERPFMDLMSGYVLRALDRMPRQGDRAPWRLKQNYLSDLRMVRYGRIDDGVLAFDTATARKGETALTTV